MLCMYIYMDVCIFVCMYAFSPLEDDKVLVSVTSGLVVTIPVSGITCHLLHH